VLLEVPSGTFNPSLENPEDAARRELLEETGYAAGELISLGRINEDPTKESHTIYPFLSIHVERVSSQNLNAGECIDGVEVPLDSIEQRAFSGEIDVAVSIATIFRASKKLKEIGQRAL